MVFLGQRRRSTHQCDRRVIQLQSVFSSKILIIHFWRCFGVYLGLKSAFLHLFLGFFLILFFQNLVYLCLFLELRLFDFIVESLGINFTSGRSRWLRLLRLLISVLTLLFDPRFPLSLRNMKLFRGYLDNIIVFWSPGTWLFEVCGRINI